MHSYANLPHAKGNMLDDLKWHGQCKGEKVKGYAKLSRLNMIHTQIHPLPHAEWKEKDKQR